MKNDRRNTQGNIDDAGDVHTRHLIGLTRRSDPATQECRITEPHKKILGRVSNHRLPRPIEKNLEQNSPLQPVQRYCVCHVRREFPMVPPAYAPPRRFPASASCS